MTAVVFLLVGVGLILLAGVTSKAAVVLDLLFLMVGCVCVLLGVVGVLAGLLGI